ncbi:MAG: biotin--[acetyl-CoA-carboxylase] ligase [Candidatus Dormibacteria bacterium]
MTMQQPTALTPERRARLLAAGRGAFPAFQLEAVARTPSTQDRVRSRARGGAEAGYCCVAGEQTAGRGRQGRRWSAAAGSSLLVSLLLRPDRVVLPVVPLLAGVAVADALAEVAGLVVGLKWPNDVLVDGAKLAGLLAEVEPAARGRDAVIVGLGLNLRSDAFPAGSCGASLHRVAPALPTWDELLGSWLAALALWLRRCEAEGSAALLDAWRAHAVGLGSPVTAGTAPGSVRGVAVDIDPGGALLVDTAEGQVRLVAGDVHLVPEASDPTSGPDISPAGRLRRTATESSEPGGAVAVPPGRAPDRPT